MSNQQSLDNLTHCNKCGKPLSGSAITFESPTLMKVDVECPNGHNECMDLCSPSQVVKKIKEQLNADLKE